MGESGIMSLDHAQPPSSKHKLIYFGRMYNLWQAHWSCSGTSSWANTFSFHHICHSTILNGIISPVLSSPAILGTLCTCSHSAYTVYASPSLTVIHCWFWSAFSFTFLPFPWVSFIQSWVVHCVPLIGINLHFLLTYCLIENWFMIHRGGKKRIAFPG